MVKPDEDTPNGDEDQTEADNPSSGELLPQPGEEASAESSSTAGETAANARQLSLEKQWLYKFNKRNLVESPGYQCKETPFKESARAAS